MFFPTSTFLALALSFTSALSASIPIEEIGLAARDSTAAIPNPLTCPVLPKKNHDKEIKQGKYYKISAFVNKLPNITDEYFHQYWTQCDIPLALDCKEFKENVVKFNLIHQTPELKGQFVALGYPVLDYDGIIEFWVKDIPTWQKVTASECWQGVRTDAKTFAVWPFKFMYSYEVLTFDRT